MRPFEAHMGQKANTLLSNITTNSSPNNLNWENAEHACLDRKNLIHPPIPAEILHDLQKWSEDEVNINTRYLSLSMSIIQVQRTIVHKQLQV